MSIDVVDLRTFYGQRLGVVARRFIGRGIRALWRDTAGQRLLGIGYATPYLGLFREEAERCLALMPAPQGVRIYDPVPNVITRRADLERAQLLVQSRSRPALQAFLQQWTEKLHETTPRGLRWHLDVDPIEFD